MRGLSSGARVKDDSLKEELLEEKRSRSGNAKSWKEADLATESGLRPSSSVTVLVPTQASIFRWSSEGATIEGVDEATIGLLDEHMLSLDELGRRYCTSLDAERPEHSQGMNPDRAEQVLSMVGPNELSPPPSEPAWMLFLKELTAPLNLMLICAALLCILIYILSITDDADTESLQLGLVLLAVILGNTLVDFTQRMNAERVLKSFSKLCPTSTLVVRGGETTEIDPTQLVMGDVVMIRAGDKIPADVRFIWCASAKVDNSSLTGESVPLQRQAKATTDNSRDAENMGFFGTTLITGSAYGVVVRTGDRTTMGQIATSAEKPPPSPLTMEMHRFVTVTALIACITAATFFVLGMVFVDSDFLEEFVLIIGILVAFVPQGLPATVTMLLTFAAKRLKDANVLVKDLNAVDTLGTITLLASDKTGTLTVNRMTVVDLWMNGRLVVAPALAGDNTRIREEEFDADKTANAKAMLQCFLLNSTANFAGGQAEGYGGADKVIGDATESGMLRFAAPMLLARDKDLDAYRDRFEKVFEIPFDSSRKWSLSIHKVPHSMGELTLFIKGAPERVIAKCSSMLAGKGGSGTGASSINPIDTSFHQGFSRAYEELAGRGERLLACAMLPLDRRSFPENCEFSDSDYPESGYQFIGLVGLRDPPKPGVAAAVKECSVAGVQVVMVTGDHPLTADAIARQVGILKGETKATAARRLMISIDQVGVEEYDCAVIHGDQIDSLTKDQWNETLSKKEIVFARATPHHKLEIVTRFQALGHIVGVTGDGVNDSLALKRADMGIAMALTGSDVSKEAAAIILLDDHFASVVRGIREGRLVFNNLKKSIMYTLCHIVPEVVPFLLYIILGIPAAINSFLILCLDLGTEIGPALSFAWEAPEDDIMNVAPRRFVKPLAPPVVARRDEVPALSEISNIEVREVDVMRPENQAVAHRLGYYWFRFCQWRLLGQNEEDERLVDTFVYSWSYGQAGVIITVGALTAFFWQMWTTGICASDLLGAATDGYFDDDADDLTTCSGKTIDADNQLVALYKAQSAYFVSVVVIQCFNAYVCKVRAGMPWGPRFCINKRTYFACTLSLLVATFIVVTPGVRYVLYARPFHIIVVLAPLGAGIFVIFYEAVRRKLFPTMGLVSRKRIKAERARLMSTESSIGNGLERSKALSGTSVSQILEKV